MLVISWTESCRLPKYTNETAIYYDYMYSFQIFESKNREKKKRKQNLLFTSNWMSMEQSLNASLLAWTRDCEVVFSIGFSCQWRWLSMRRRRTNDCWTCHWQMKQRKKIFHQQTLVAVSLRNSILCSKFAAKTRACVSNLQKSKQNDIFPSIPKEKKSRRNFSVFIFVGYVCFRFDSTKRRRTRICVRLCVSENPKANNKIETEYYVQRTHYYTLALFFSSESATIETSE